MGIAVKQGVDWAPLQVAVANGTACSSVGTCKVCLKLPHFSANTVCQVVELANAYEAILGEDWLNKHSATWATSVVPSSVGKVNKSPG